MSGTPDVPRGPISPGFTWADATPSMPGHWERVRVGQVPQGIPLTPGGAAPEPVTVDVRDHRGDASAAEALARLGGIKKATVISNNPSGTGWKDSNGDSVFTPDFERMLTSRGNTSAEVGFIVQSSKLFSPPGKDNEIDKQIDSTVIDGVNYFYVASPSTALSILDSKKTPLEWYADQWSKDAHEGTAADAAAKTAADAAAKTAADKLAADKLKAGNATAGAGVGALKGVLKTPPKQIGNTTKAVTPIGRYAAYGAIGLALYIFYS